MISIGGIFEALHKRMSVADDRYGGFASTHEALGVITEEYDELREAIKENDMQAVMREALDIAAAACRLAEQIGEGNAALMRRSVK